MTMEEAMATYEIKVEHLIKGRSPQIQRQELLADNDTEAIKLYNKKKEETELWNRRRSHHTGTRFVYKGLDRVDEDGVVTNVL